MTARLRSPFRISTLFKLSLFCVVCFVAARAGAQNRTAAYPQGGIAVIDVKYILDRHNRFQRDMASLRQQFQQMADSLKKERETILGLEKRLQPLPVGGQDYRQLDEEIARRKADWTVKANRYRKDIQNSETRLLWNVYSEIRLETKRYAEQNQIGLVMQFNGEEPDNKKPQEVLKGISRPFLYVSQAYDVTPHVLAALNRGQPSEKRPANIGRGGARQGVAPLR